MRNGLRVSLDGTGAARGRALPAAAALCALVAGLLAGCAPAGVDGDFTDDWAAVGEPKIFTPEENVCHPGAFKEISSASTYETVDCAKSHGTETIHVGTFEGGNASGSEPPGGNSAAMKAAYTECEQTARDFLGDDWRSGRLWLGVTLPSAKAWSGGAHWFGCDLIEVTSKDDDSPVTRTASLKEGLRGERSLALTCFQVTSKNDVVDEMKPLSCTQPHNAEYVGVYVPPDTAYVKLTDARWDSFHNACRNLIAKYVGVSASTAKRTGSVASPFSQEEWERGNRGVRCHVWLENKKTSKSLKGAGALPR